MARVYNYCYPMLMYILLMITANYHKAHRLLATGCCLSCLLQTARVYLQNLCQVIKSSVCPQKDRSTGAERVSLRNSASLIQFNAGGWSLLLPTVSHLRAATGFRQFSSIFLFVHAVCCILSGFFFIAPYVILMLSRIL